MIRQVTGDVLSISMNCRTTSSHIPFIHFPHSLKPVKMEMKPATKHAKRSMMGNYVTFLP